MNNGEYNRLLELKELMGKKAASASDKKEYISLLYHNGNITQEQYSSFLSNQNSDEIVNAALTIGGVLLATWLISKLLD